MSSATRRRVDDDFWSLAVASPAEVAEALAMPYDAVLEAVRRGDIESTRLGGRRIFISVPALARKLGVTS